MQHDSRYGMHSAGLGKKKKDDTDSEFQPFQAACSMHAVWFHMTETHLHVHIMCMLYFIRMHDLTFWSDVCGPQSVTSLHKKISKKKSS